MATVAQTLAAAGLVVAHPGATPPMTYNILLRVPAEAAAGTPTVVTGTLTNSAGGRRTAAQRPTLSIFLGPGATLRGVAHWLENNVWPADGPTRNPYDQTRLAQALWVWNQSYLTGLGADAWRTGLWLPVPVEVDGAQWVTDWDTVFGWSATFPDHQWAILDTPAQHLPLPDPVALRTSVTSWLTGKDTEDIADALERDLIGNPFEAVFRVVEILRQVETGDADDAVDLVVETVNRLAPWELALLGGVTAGHALLRRFWSVLGAATGGDAAACRDALGPALGLTRTGSGPWQPPTVVGPTVVPDELPPVPPTDPKKKAAPLVEGGKQPGENPGGIHAMVLGRDLCLGTTGSHTQKNGSTWVGPAYGGRLGPAAFIRNRSAELGLTTPEEHAGARVIELIAPNEGQLDGARSADKAMISTGIQQWSAHANEELPVLLARFNHTAPDHYDLFFGMYGLQVEPWWRVTINGQDVEAPVEVADPTKVRADNPDAFAADGTAKQGKDFAPRYATLFKVPPGGGRQRLPAPPETVTALLPRHAFFDVTAQGKTYTIGPAWAARVRLAALCSTEYNVVQIWTGIRRFHRLDRQPLGKTAKLEIRGRKFRIRDFMASEFAAAVALDQHINEPFSVVHSIDRAITRTEQAIARMPEAKRTELRPFDEPAGSPLRAPWLRLFQLHYLLERTLNDKEKRDLTLLKLHDKFIDNTFVGLDAEPGSFLGWVGP